MKKSIIVFFVAFVAVSVMIAKDHVVVVHPIVVGDKGRTEVTCHPGGEGSDTLVVTPAADATTIHVKVRDLDGGVISHQMLPANIETSVSVETPDEGGEDPVLEIGDDEGTVYEE